MLLVLLGSIGVGVWWTLYRAESDISPGRVVTVRIPKGASGDQVASMLAKSGVVANARMFRLRAAALDAADELKAGSYRLKTGSSYDAVIGVLRTGPPEAARVTLTIPEGWDLTRTAARVERKLGIPAAEFEQLAKTGAAQFDFAFLAEAKSGSLEGYLFPKTYSIRKGAKAADVIKVMLEQYQREIASIDYTYAKSKNLTERDVLIIASMIEREVVIPKERPLVSSVIYNRLKIGMRLQMCSSVQYILDWKPTLSLKDIETPSPYNTYLHEGLPPGPICSPGLSAIQAAAAPEKTRYLYFVLTHKNGSQSFATDYDDFMRLKAQAKRGLK